MKPAFAIAIGLILLGIAGFIFIPKLLQKSKVDQLEANRWRVALQKGDEFFDTGIHVPRQGIVKVDSEDSAAKWIIKIDDTPYTGSGGLGKDFIVTCKDKPLSQCGDYRDNLLVKNDASKDILLNISTTDITSWPHNADGTLNTEEIEKMK